MKNAFFYFGLALLFTHELDAVTNHEWRVLPILSSLPDRTGESSFVLLHVPLFAIVLASIASLNRKVRARAQIVASGFLVVHGLLHTLFSGHAEYGFSSVLSSSLIFGAAACGAGYLATVVFSGPQRILE